MMLSHNPIAELFTLACTAIVTGDKAETILRNTTIVVGADGRIERATPSIETSIPTEYYYLSGTGEIMIPGLTNIHTHLFSQGKPLNPKLATPRGQRMATTLVHSPLDKPYMAAIVRHSATTLLESGVVTIRTFGDVGCEAVALHDQIDVGQTLGPRILTSGPLMAILGGHDVPFIASTNDTPEEARTAIVQNLKVGVNVIKTVATGGVIDAQEIGEAGSSQMSMEQMRATCDEVHQYGVIIGAHAQSLEGVRHLLLAGADTTEHGSVPDDELIGMFRHSPSTSCGYSTLVPALPAGLLPTLFGQDATGITGIRPENSKSAAGGMVSNVRQAHGVGSMIGTGADTGMIFVPQYATWRGLELLVAHAGFSPVGALHAATAANAPILGVNVETGFLGVGKSADLLVLNVNPLDDLCALEHPALVIAAGHPVWRPALERFADIDTLLDEVYA